MPRYIRCRPLMRPSYILPVLLACWSSLACAQRFDPLRPPNTFRNADNPYYWRNRPPFEGYWQQDVHYTIDARMDDERNVLNATERLVYFNNSPDTLRFVFFHLYQEAYNKGSYAFRQRQAEGWDLRGADRLPYAGTRVHQWKSNGADLRTEQDNTVVKVWLNEPLPPGGKTTFDIGFRTHWAFGVPRRMKLVDAWGHKHFDGTHWYPRIAVYDRVMGWDTQQHLGNELYGDFGGFDVSLDFPADYILEATGWLQNPEQVLPDDLRRKLDISNFKDKEWNSAPSVITPHDTLVRKVWRYHAENVHDFAFTADPTYRIGEAQWSGVRCVALAQEPHCRGWQNAAEYAAKVIKAHSEWFGMYGYPKMVVADAQDGMEYPMLTLDGGSDPDYRGLFVHEIGHNWFYGMIGNNETYRAMLDEGFTQFLTGWGLSVIDGDTLVADTPKTAYERRWTKPEIAHESEVYSGYMRDAVRNGVPPIDTHSDEYQYYEDQHMGGGGHNYFKTATMLYNLKYVLGDSLFWHGMQYYFNQWKFCHPYPEDMRNSFTQATHVDLTWFFDAWIGTDKTIDYAVRSVQHNRRKGKQRIVLQRKGMQMPIDLQVLARDGKTYDFHIPNTWHTKATTASVLPRWIGWDKLQERYVAHVDIPSGIADVRIDTSGMMADRNMLNNALRKPIDIGFDHHVRNRADRHNYEGFVRPDAWFNGYDGVKVGAHFNGSYMRHKHRIHASAWINTGFGQALPDGGVDTRHDALSFNVRYDNATDFVLRGSSYHLKARVLDGLQLYGGGLRWNLPGRATTVSLDAKYMLRADSSDLTYLQYPDQWEPNAWNGIATAQLWDRFTHRGGDLTLTLRARSSAIGSASYFGSISATAVEVKQLGPLQLRVRVHGQYGEGDIPRESALYLAGASPEEMMEDKYVRSIGLVPYDWLGYGAEANHFQHGGGLNLRGYAGYLAPERLADEPSIVYTYFGNSGYAINGELDIDGLFPFRPSFTRRWLLLDAYLFGDIGSITYLNTSNNQVLADPRADAGAGVCLTIKRWWRFTDLKPITLRFDMPLLLSAVPAAEEDHFGFRYLVGVGRTF